MSMTRKHVEAIAKTVRDLRDPADMTATAAPGTFAAGHEQGWEAALNAVAAHLGGEFENFNTNFDIDRFLTATRQAD